MAKDDLVFLTPDNKEKIQKRVAPKLMERLEEESAEQKKLARLQRIRHATIHQFLNRYVPQK